MPVFADVRILQTHEVHSLNFPRICPVRWIPPDAPLFDSSPLPTTNPPIKASRKSAGTHKPGTNGLHRCVFAQVCQNEIVCNRLITLVTCLAR